MKQRQFITAFSLIVVLSGLSPVVAADVAGEEVRHAMENKSPIPTRMVELTDHQMDSVTAGNIFDFVKHVVRNGAAWITQDVSGMVRQAKYDLLGCEILCGGL